MKVTGKTKKKEIDRETGRTNETSNKHMKQNKGKRDK